MTKPPPPPAAAAPTGLSLPYAAAKSEEKEERVIWSEGREEPEHPVHGEAGDKTRATTHDVRPTAPEITSKHHPQEDDGIQRTLLYLHNNKT